MQITINNTLFIGKNLITLKKIDSTNNHAKFLTANSGPVPDGTVILAEEQYGGRGEAGNSWQSDPKQNLTFSIILDCSFLPPSRQFRLSIAVSLGISDCISPLLGGRVSIKWPNDIYAGRKKLGGILIENLLAGSSMKTSIIGIGLNVNQDNFTGLPNATSLKREANAGFHPETLLGSLCHHIEARFLQLKGGAGEELTKAYQQRLLGFGRTQLFRAGPAPAGKGPEAEPFEGIISGITPEGKLIVATAEGVKTFNKKEIVFL